MGKLPRGVKRVGKEALKSQVTSGNKTPCVCPTREEAIIDDSEESKSQDSIYCEGLSSAWLHHGCACLSKQAFNALRDSKDPLDVQIDERN